jgi:hypothetical protein
MASEWSFQPRFVHYLLFVQFRQLIVAPVGKAGDKFVSHQGVSEVMGQGANFAGSED